MITLTKIFRFESAHAIHGYPGACSNIHGHSYELHVSVASKQSDEDFLGGMGIVMDFKDLKAIVQESVICKLDHQLILSTAYLTSITNELPEALVVFDTEPTAENLLIFIRNEIIKSLPEHIKLFSLKLWETRENYAEWSTV